MTELSTIEWGSTSCAIQKTGHRASTIYHDILTSSRKRKRDMSNNDFEEEATGLNDFAEMIGDMHRWHVEASIRLAHLQGLRAGVRPNTEPPKPGDEEYPPIKRIAFIE